MNLPPPPPPPRYPLAPGTTTGVMIPPPPGPPPGSIAGQQPSWHGNYGRVYDGRQAFGLPPPPPSGQHQPYNPRFHADMAAGQTMAMHNQRRPNDVMSATYIPTGVSYGEGVGIPGFSIDEAALLAQAQSGWNVSTPQSAGESHSNMTPSDEATQRDRLYLNSGAQTRGVSNASTATKSASSIPPDVAAQWSMDTVLIWLARNQFSGDWQETFKALNLHGAQFLELGSSHNGRGNLGMMHQQVYPQLLKECSNSGTGWDPSREREEGKRMRRLIRSIVTGKPVDPAKNVSAHARRESQTAIHGANLPSAGTDATESPNVSANPMVQPAP